jgi:hypothetical protein
MRCNNRNRRDHELARGRSIQSEAETGRLLKRRRRNLCICEVLAPCFGPCVGVSCQYPVFWTGSTRLESSSSIIWSVITRARWEIEASTALAAIPPKTGSSAPLAPVVRSSRCAVRIKHLTIPRIERRKVGQAANPPWVQPWRSIPASRQTA